MYYVRLAEFEGVNILYKKYKATDNIWIIEDGSVKCYLLEGDEQCILLDTGYGKEDIGEFVKTITEKPITVIITHADRDHVGGIDQFDNVNMHPSDFERCKRFNEVKQNHFNPIWEGDTFDIGTFKLEAVLIPGHTPGSIALLDRNNRILFGGDSVQKRIVMAERNFAAYYYSMVKLSEYINEFDIIYSPHGEETYEPSLITQLVEASRAMLDGEIVGEKPKESLPFGDVQIYTKGSITFIH